MNIVLTRPLIDTENLMSKLLTMGHKIIHLPTLKISEIKIKEIDLNDYDALIFTSANAVRFFKFKNEKREILCFCVGSITEKKIRSHGFNNTISADGNVNALKNLIINSQALNQKSKLAYICGDNLSTDLDTQLINENLIIEKIMNYKSEKITTLNEKNIELLKKFSPNLLFVYSQRSAESLIEITRKYSLDGVMTQCTVMCISDKIGNYFSKSGLKKVKIFRPGDEIIEIEKWKK